MGVKKKKKAMEPVRIQIPEPNLDESVRQDSGLCKFLENVTASDQLKALLQCSLWLEKQQSGPIIQAACHILATAFFACKPKNFLRKVITSCMQGAPGEHHTVVMETLQHHLVTNISNHDSKRAVVDNMAAFLDNFPIGEATLVSMYKQVLPFLCETLQTFYHDARQATGADSETTSMNNCLSSTQLLNKYLQKIIQHNKNDLGKSDEIKSTLLQINSVMWKVLQKDFLLDCCTASGIAVPLILKTVLGPDSLFEILYRANKLAKLPHQQEEPSSLPSTNPKPSPLLDQEFNPWDLSTSSHLCLLGGLVAMLSPAELFLDQAGNRNHGLEIVAGNILFLTESIQDTNTKLTASRSLTLLTHKLREGLRLKELDGSFRDHLKGDSDHMQKIMAYVWNHWEDSVDTVRHQTRRIFENILEVHLMATGEDGRSSPFIHQKAVALLDLSWHSKGRYGPLCVIIQVMGAHAVIDKKPELIRELLKAMGEQSLAPYVSELYEKLVYHYQLEDRTDAKMEGVSVTQEVNETINKHIRPNWIKKLFDPVLDALCDGTARQKTYIIEYVIPMLMLRGGSVFPYIVERLTSVGIQTSGGDQNVGALVTCMKEAKSLGILQDYKGNPDLWNGVVSIETIKLVLCHTDKQIRLDTFAILCDHNRTTEVISSCDLDLARFFLQYNLDSQAPGYRQHLVALLKKLFIRLRDGGSAQQRTLNTSHKSNKPTDTAVATLDNYRSFLHWLCDLIFKQLHVGAAFPRRTTALCVLSMLVNIFGCKERQDSASKEFHVVDMMTPARIQTLLECLADTFELNKTESFKVLSALPTKYLYTETAEKTAQLLQCALDLACTTRPQDCTTAAYLLRVVLLLPHAACMARQLRRRAERIETPATCAPLEVVALLLDRLQDQLSMARTSLLHAAATQPLYPVLHCVRYLLSDFKLSSEAQSSEWKELVGKLITMCFEVAEVVSPVVSNSSPEGNIPTEALNNVTGNGDLDDSVAKVTSMPEYLVVCCWRSVKEVSLLLGQLTQSAPLIGTCPDSDHGHISFEQLLAIGQYFTKQLLESIHRGAFELAYAGFVKMAEMLWKCRIPAVNQLPRRWLEDILDAVAEDGTADKLCATRRSAGVPFYIQALVSTEPPTTGRPCFKTVMEKLLLLAWPRADQGPGENNIPQVHALNILRALYRDTRLGEDVFPYIAEGIQVATLGYTSQLWNIRNSSTLLFSALITRIFGVKRTKDELSRKNCMTGRVFFHRFPSLHSFLHKQLLDATSELSQEMTSSSRSPLHPSLYPLLLVLGRLYPSVIEGSDSTYNLRDFLKPVLSCAYSPVYKTRVMSARALSPLVGKEDIKDVLVDLVGKLPVEIRLVSQNATHGILLQIEQLLLVLMELPDLTKREILSVISQNLMKAGWIFTSETSYSVKTACLRVTSTAYLLSLCNTNNARTPEPANHPDSVWENIPHAADLLEVLSSSQEESTLQVPGAVEFLENAAHYLLWMKLSEDAGNAEELEAVVLKILQSDCYEVRLQSLDVLGKCVSRTDEEKNGDGDAEMHDTQDDDDCGIGDSLSNPALHRISSWAREVIQNSEKLKSALVSMAMIKETHPECLEKVLVIITQHRRFGSLPWDGQVTEYSASQVMDRLYDIFMNSNREELRCSAVALMSRIIQHSYSEVTEESKSWLEKWVNLMDKHSAADNSVDLRMTCATSLVQTAPLVLLDPQQILGTEVFRLWTAAVRLLQDDDTGVRQRMGKILPHITKPSSGRAQSVMQPAVTLPLVIHAMIQTHWGPSCLQTLISWMDTPLDAEWLPQDSDVRLFDKGEMNTYSDSIGFARVVAKTLITLTSSEQHHSSDVILPQVFFTSDLTRGQGSQGSSQVEQNTLKLDEDCTKFLKEIYADSMDKIHQIVESMPQMERTYPLLEQCDSENLVEDISRLCCVVKTIRLVLKDNTLVQDLDKCQKFHEHLQKVRFPGALSNDLSGI